jgi:hypothetical protein
LRRHPILAHSQGSEVESYPQLPEQRSCSRANSPASSKQASAEAGPNPLWVADITYIAITGGFVYLAAILDAWSRRVVGYAISRSIDARLALAALKAAIRTRNPPPERCVHRSDRGSQYASTAGSSNSSRPATCPCDGHAAPESATNCETALVAGAVSYQLDRPAADNVLICCSQPKADIVIDL